MEAEWLVLAALDLLINERNSVHGNRPQSDQEYDDRVREVLPVLERALDASAFLARSTLLWIDDVRPVEAEPVPFFEVTAEVAMGDHPDWELTQRVLPNIVFDNRFYVALDDTDRLLNISPFLLAMRCEECHHRHVYYPDKLQDKKVILNSIDRGPAPRFVGRTTS
jgi:hypothetical protein